MLDNLWKSTGEVLRERVTSPVLVPLAMSWALWNYKFFVVLFSSASVTTTFALIHRLYPGWFEILLWPGQWLPLATAVFVIFGLPMVEAWVLRVTLPQQRSLLELRRDHANATRLTLQESQALRADLLRMEATHKEQFEKKLEELKELERELAATEKELREATQPFGLNATETMNLRKFASVGRKYRIDELEIKTEDLSRLVQLGLVSDAPGETSGSRVFALTRAGEVRRGEVRPKQQRI